MDRSFWRGGHNPTLLSAFLYFDLSFMVWYLLGPLQVQITTALELATQQRAMMVEVPIHLPMGMLADRVLGAVKQATGSYAEGLWLFAGLALFGWLGLSSVKRRWREGWTGAVARV